MSNWRSTLAIALVMCLVWADALRATSPVNPSSIKQQVDEFGVGAKIGLKLAGGEKLRGSIDATEDKSFLFSPDRETSPRRIAYDQVAQVQLAKRRYSAHGQPNALEARRVALALGVGKHVVVNVAGPKEFHGHIQALGPDQFTILPDHQTAPVQIAYSDVLHLEKNLSLGATIVLLVLIAAAVIVAASVAATR